VQTNLVAIRSCLIESGHECSVINLTRFRQAEHDQVYFPRSAWEVLSLILRLRYDVAHLHIGGDVTLRLLLLGMVSGLGGARTVLTLHSGGYPDSEAGRTAHRWTLRGFVFRRFDRIISVNEQLRTMFVERFGVRPERVRVILPHVLPGEAPEAALPEKVERFLASHDSVLMSMGWLEPEYDFALQIRALGAVREKFPGVGLLILGDGRLGPDLRAQSDASGYGDHILLAGDLPHEAALTAMSRCRIFLRTTWYDGDSISVREALHFGIPVVASDNGMRPAGVTLIPARSERALEEAIERLLRGGDGPVRASRSPGDDSHIRSVLKLYSELVEGEPPAPLVSLSGR
jgi:glycosyltransferase involved in cell wall biosynthesis